MASLKTVDDVKRINKMLYDYFKEHDDRMFKLIGVLAKSLGKIEKDIQGIKEKLNEHK